MVRAERPRSSSCAGIERSLEPGMSEAPREVEAKFHASLRAFRELDRLGEIDGWRVASRRATRLRDAYWDTPDRRLGQQGRTLRVREMDGQPVGELTYKGPPEDGGRSEEIAHAPVGSTPREWMTLPDPDARAIVADLHQRGVLDSLQPDVVLLNPRRDLILRNGDAEEVLSLDEVEIERQPYLRRYVELELKHGSRAAHDALAASLSERFQLRPSRTGKVQAARNWLRRA
jgi:hypothetical protein